ncbi:MAG: vWA domain-containing protein, partial [Paraclostridium sp.]
AFDTTGSMNAYISDVKNHVTSLIPELFKNTTDLRIGVVAFGDYCDMDSKHIFGDAYQVLDLTNNQDGIISFVKNAKSTSGGDGDEFYELVIKKIQEETSWREGSNKSILLIGDCNPHGVGYTYRGICVNNQIDWKVEAAKCKDLGIKIDTLSIKGAQFYEDLANITGGICIPFKSSQKTSQMMEGYTYTRTMSTAAFTATLDKVMASGDDELIATYNVFSKTISEL